MHVLAVFGNGRGLMFMSFYTIIANVPMCIPHNMNHTGHIENYKQLYKIKFTNAGGFVSFIFNSYSIFPAHKHRLAFRLRGLFLKAPSSQAQAGF